MDLNNLSKLHQTGKHSDLTIVALKGHDEVQFQVHKAILDLRCPLLLAQNATKIENDRLCLGYPAEVGERFIKHIYSLEWTEPVGGLAVDGVQRELQSLLRLADMASAYELEDLTVDISVYGSRIITEHLAGIAPASQVLSMTKAFRFYSGLYLFLGELLDVVEEKMEG